MLVGAQIKVGAGEIEKWISPPGELKEEDKGTRSPSGLPR